MTKTQAPQQRAAEILNATEAALRKAGPAGLAMTDLADMLGCSRQMAWWYLANCPCAARAKTNFTQASRWFHSDNIADAAAYAVRTDAEYAAKASQRAVRRVRWAGGRLDELRGLLAGAGRDGVDKVQCHQVLGMATNSVGSVLTELCRRGEVRRRRMGAGGVTRYWLAGCFPAKPEKPAAQRKAPKEKPARTVSQKKEKAKKTPKKKPATVAKTALPVDRATEAQRHAGWGSGTGQATKGGAAPRGEPIFTAKTKFTVCASHVDTRFCAGRVSPFFGAMTPGSYLKTGSAIERAYPV